MTAGSLAKAGRWFMTVSLLPASLMAAEMDKVTALQQEMAELETRLQKETAALQGKDKRLPSQRLQSSSPATTEAVEEKQSKAPKVDPIRDHSGISPYRPYTRTGNGFTHYGRPGRASAF